MCIGCLRYASGSPAQGQQHEAGSGFHVHVFLSGNYTPGPCCKQAAPVQLMAKKAAACSGAQKTARMLRPQHKALVGHALWALPWCDHLRESLPGHGQKITSAA